MRGSTWSSVFIVGAGAPGCGSRLPWDDSGLDTFTPDTGDTTTKTISLPGDVKRFVRAAPIKPLQPE